jgi:hypothetical protein
MNKSKRPCVTDPSDGRVAEIGLNLARDLGFPPIPDIRLLPANSSKGRSLEKKYFWRKTESLNPFLTFARDPSKKIFSREKELLNHSSDL